MSSRSTSGLLMVLDSEATFLSRAGTAADAHFALKNNLYFDLAANTGVLSTTRPFEGGIAQFGDFSPELAAKVLEFDVVKTSARKHEELHRMLWEIAGKEPPDPHLLPPESCPRFTELNQSVRQKAAGPVLREAGFEGDLARIHSVREACPHLDFDSCGLVGPLGETAMHTAAAGGHVEAMRLLYSLKASIDAQDSQGETPMHYAAMAGKASAVRLLIELGASHSRESFEGETALEVAQLNLAYFLGVKTKEVEDLLSQPNEALAGLSIFREVEKLRSENEALRLKLATWTAGMGITDTAAPQTLHRVRNEFARYGVKTIPLRCLVDLLAKDLGCQKAQQLLQMAVQERELGAGHGGTIDLDRLLAWVWELPASCSPRRGEIHSQPVASDLHCTQLPCLMNDTEPTYELVEDRKSVV